MPTKKSELNQKLKRIVKNIHKSHLGWHLGEHRRLTHIQTNTITPKWFLPTATAIIYLWTKNQLVWFHASSPFRPLFLLRCRLLLIVCSVRLFTVYVCVCVCVSVRWLLVIYSICLWKWFVITHLSCFNFELRQKLDTQLFYYVWALSTFVRKIEKLRKEAISKQRLLSDEKLVSHVNNAHKIIINFFFSYFPSTSCDETTAIQLIRSLLHSSLSSSSSSSQSSLFASSSSSSSMAIDMGKRISKEKNFDLNSGLK